MHFIWKLIIGFIIGLVAHFLMPGNQKLGIIMTTILGVIGAFVGAFLGQALGIYAEGEPAGFIFSVIGALIILFIAKRFAK